MKNEQVEYVVAIHLPGFECDGMVAEAIGSTYLRSVLPHLDGDKASKWLLRAIECVVAQEHVLRAVAVTREQYVKHLRGVSDWDRHTEPLVVGDVLAASIPERLWMIEISLPNLFPANKRKVGEIILDGSLSPGSKLAYDMFVLARLPGKYVFFGGAEKGKPHFIQFPSSLTSHTPLYGCPTGVGRCP